MKGLLLAVGDDALEALFITQRWHSSPAKAGRTRRTVRLRRFFAEPPDKRSAETSQPPEAAQPAKDVKADDLTETSLVDAPAPATSASPDALNLVRQEGGENVMQAPRTWTVPAEAQVHIEIANRQPGSLMAFSGRELLVLQLLAIGYTTEQTAALASLQSHQVHEVVNLACARIGCKNVLDALVIMRSEGLIR